MHPVTLVYFSSLCNIVIQAFRTAAGIADYHVSRVDPVNELSNCFNMN